MSKVKLGIVGFGHMGANHAAKIKEGAVPELEIMAVASVDAPGRAAAREMLGDSVKIFESSSELMESGLCDAVLIVTPHYLHPELAIEAFKNNLHVLLEKPAGVYTKLVREMNEAAAKSGRVFAMMYNQRTNCLYRRMKEIVENGELGAIKRVNWIITDWYRPQAYYNSGGWRATWKGEGGGVLINQCPHNLDLLQWITGMPSMVQAFCHNGKWHDIETEDDVTAYMEYPNGATGVFVTSTGDAPGTNRFEITGERGKLVCESNKLLFYKLAVNERDFVNTATEGFAKIPYEVIEVDTDGENPQHAGVMNAFAACILRGEALVAKGEEGINGLMLSNAMHLSSWLKQPVQLPIDEDLYLQKLDELRASSRPKK